MHLCEWPHLFQDFAKSFLSSTANRTTANKQGAPCPQLRAWRSCLQTPPNDIIPISHPHPLAVYPGKSKVCANSANQGPWDESRDSHHRQEWSPRPTPLVPLLPQLQWPSSTSPSTRAKLPKAGSLPSPSRVGLVRGHWSPPAVPGSWIRSACRGKALRETRSPREPVENCFSNLV